MWVTRDARGYVDLPATLEFAAADATSALTSMRATFDAIDTRAHDRKANGNHADLIGRVQRLHCGLCLSVLADWCSFGSQHDEDEIMNRVAGIMR